MAQGIKTWVVDDFYLKMVLDKYEWEMLTLQVNMQEETI
ncbi:protein of unknown function [Pseudodesulfovibrio piezophilus C1TLV30]|uniref:Uncharacterized protein n=1 Tax=Pseudodesulfovibrio piezophilus (strain DSM 21447 / JCM 15486 / C1TLV30) TaxID=1322246 RepID=M1WS86_PSEP2|nr:protein of unknown function [Pseudodesulfovibrio piezophilus C1TLV30]